MASHHQQRCVLVASVKRPSGMHTASADAAASWGEGVLEDIADFRHTPSSDSSPKPSPSPSAELPDFLTTFRYRSGLQSHTMNLPHAGFQQAVFGTPLGIRRIDPRLDRHLLLRRLAHVALAAGWENSPAVRHEPRIGFLRGECQLLDVFDVVHASSVSPIAAIGAERSTMMLFGSIPTGRSRRACRS